MKYIAFYGRYNQLKNMGYTYQSLMAANHKQWHKKGFRVWRKGSELTHDSLGDRLPCVYEKLIELGIDNLPFKECTYFKGRFRLYLYLDKRTKKCTTDHLEWRRDKQEADIEIREYEWEKICITPDLVEPLIELHELGWVSLRSIEIE